MKKRICISEKYPAYWEYDGKPVICWAEGRREIFSYGPTERFHE